MERRNSPRARCRFSCDLTRLHDRASGTVLDVSEGGLSVYTQLEVDQGDPLLVLMNVPKVGKIELETIIWHIRPARQRNSGEPCYLLGLMLYKAPDAYFELVPDSMPDEQHESDRVLEPQAGPLLDSETDTQGLTLFRIRIKARSGPRTRVLSLGAESENEARAHAMSELNNEWEVREVHDHGQLWSP